MASLAYPAMVMRVAESAAFSAMTVLAAALPDSDVGKGGPGAQRVWWWGAELPGRTRVRSRGSEWGRASRTGGVGSSGRASVKRRVPSALPHTVCARSTRARLSP
jgi:hypothetical protein